MIELLGPMPKNYAISAKKFEDFFAKDARGKYVFRKIDGLKHFPLARLLTDKYHLMPEEADSLADFLLPMLEWRPSDRPSSQQMLSHPWLQMPDEYDYRMNEMEYQDFIARRSLIQDGNINGSKNILTPLEELAESDEELNYACSEDNVTLDEESDRDSSQGSDSEDEQNLNGSFTGGYVPNRDIHRVDKGAGNPQFNMDLRDEEPDLTTKVTFL